MSVEEVIHAAHLKPGDRLIIGVSHSVTAEEAARFKEAVELAGFDPGQIGIVSDVQAMVIVDRDGDN